METEALATPETDQAAELGEIKRKTHFTGTVLKTTLAGAVIDIGMDTPGVVHISQLQSEPVNRVEDVVQPGQQVDVWVHRVVPKKNRIELTMIRPLDLEWRDIQPDMVVKGKVTRLEKFGAFVDIGAERPGLVHISEMTHDYIKTVGDVVKEGDEVEVKVLNVDKRKRQIKLSMKALEEPPVKEVKEKDFGLRRTQNRCPSWKKKPETSPAPRRWRWRCAKRWNDRKKNVPSNLPARANVNQKAQQTSWSKSLYRTLHNKRK